MPNQERISLAIKRFFTLEKNSRKRLLFFWSLILAPLFTAAWFSIQKEFDHIDREVFAQSKNNIQLSAHLLSEHLNTAVDVATSVSSRRSVAATIEKGDWAGVESALLDVPNVFHFIESIAVVDEKGIMRVIIPPSPNIKGKDFSFRDYYQQVMKSRKPYISAKFQKKGGKQNSIVGVSVPVFSVDNKSVAGIITFGVSTDTIAEWIKDFSGGPTSLMYVFDQDEQMVIHEDKVFMHTDDNLHRSFAHKSVSEPIGSYVYVDRINDVTFLVAHAPVVPYGWGMVVLQPSADAFKERIGGFTRISLPWMLTLGFIGALLYFIMRSRDQLREERDREQRFLDSIGDGIVAIDRGWSITLWNKTASLLSGWSKEEALGKPFGSVIKFLLESDRLEHYSFIEDAIVSGGVRSVDRGLMLVSKDGKEIPIGDSAAAITDAKGNIVGAIVVFRDVSKEREAEHVRSDFTFAAHQLRTPVTGALWNIEVAQKERSAKKRNESLSIAHDAILDIKDLEEHLIVIAEIDKGIILKHTDSIVLEDLFSDIEHDLEAQVKSRKIKLVIDLSRTPREISVDTKLFRVVLSEVVENAVQYSRERSTVVVTAYLQDNNYIFEVRDHGDGIPAEDQALVFTKFFRGTKHHTKKAGSGLGLFIAKEYMRILGGKIWFSVEAGKGTTFFISVPVQQD